MTTLKEQALECARIGMPVFPCAPNEKRPLTPRGFYDATVSIEKIEQWWTTVPNANIGTPTGYLGPDYFTIDVLDIDKRPDGNGFTLYNRMREAGELNEAMMVISTPSGGVHAYFKGSEKSGGSLRGLYVDYKAQGGYVLLPPSVVNGKPYEMLWKSPVFTLHDFQPLDWPSITLKYGPIKYLDTNGIEITQTYEMDWLAKWLRYERNGNRNNALHWAACRAVESGYTTREQLAPLMVAAELIGLTADEIASTINSAFRTVGAYINVRERRTATTGIAAG